MANKWMTKLTKDVGQMASSMPSPADHVVRMPSPSLNWAVANGGLTRGKSVCLYGPESGGKSLLAQLVIIQLQKDFPDGICILFDSEFSFNKIWFAQLGGDNDRLVVRQTNDPIQIFDYIEGEMQEMVQDGCPIVGMIIDSVKAIRYPKDHKEKSTKQVMGGGGASYLGSTLKGVLPVIRQHMITTVLVQQVYEEMDEYKKMLNPWKIPDGMALKHFSDYMLEVTRVDTKAGRIEEGTTIYGSAQQVGHKVRIRAKKNKVGAPYRCAEFSLSYTAGIINVGEEVYELAKSLHIITHPTNPETGKPNNSRWMIGNHDPIYGENPFKAWFLANPDVQEEAMTACYACQDDNILAARNFAIDNVIDINLEEVNVDDVDI